MNNFFESDVNYIRTMTDKDKNQLSKAITTISSILSGIEENSLVDDKVSSALNMFRYMSRPEIGHLFDGPGCVNFRRVVMDKIEEFRQNPLVKRDQRFVSPFVTIEEMWKESSDKRPPLKNLIWPPLTPLSP
jgi:hypothetical protein